MLKVLFMATSFVETLVLLILSTSPHREPKLHWSLMHEHDFHWLVRTNALRVYPQRDWMWQRVRSVWLFINPGICFHVSLALLHIDQHSPSSLFWLWSLMLQLHCSFSTVLDESSHLDPWTDLQKHPPPLFSSPRPPFPPPLPSFPLGLPQSSSQHYFSVLNKNKHST